MGVNKKIKKEGGYLLVGLLVYIILIGIMYTSYGVTWQNVVRREKEEELTFNLKQIRRGIEMFRKKYNNYPSSIEDLFKEKYLRKRYIDPFTGKADWKKEEKEGKLINVRSSSDLKNPAGEEYSKW